MKLFTTTAFALVAALAATPSIAQNKPAAAQQPAAPQIKPSAKAIKAIVDLQTAVNNKDYANLPAKVAAANAVATTKEDHYLIARLQLSAAASTNDSAGMQSSLDAIAQSGYLDAAKTSSLYLDLGGTFYNNKQYPQAVTAFQKASALDPNNAETSRLYGVALFQAGQKAEAATALEKAIRASSGAGQKPAEDMYRLAVQAASDAKSPEAVSIAQQWVAAYPSPDSWRNSIAIFRNFSQPDTEGTLDLLRLMQAAGALRQPTDYALFAEADAEQNNFNEAQAVLDAGVAAKLVDPNASNMRELFTALRSKPKATNADLAVATKSAVNGTALLRIGDRYYGMGNYAKAAELYRMAQGKPGVDAAVANLHIGMALARSGDKAGATAALNAVTGPRAGIAKFWLAYVGQKA